jgi:hypothetical protein
MKTPLRVFTVLAALCITANVAATPLSPNDKASFIASGIPACIAGGEKSQVTTVNWPVYCQCIMEKMADDFTKEDVFAIFVATDANRNAVGSAITSKWLSAHQGTVRACLKTSL